MHSFARVPHSAGHASAPRRPPATGRSAPQMPPPVMRSACACGGSCPRCAETPVDASTLDQASQLDGVPAIVDYEEAGGSLAIDAPMSPGPTTSPTLGGPPSATPAAATCPRNITVARILPITLSAANVAAGFHTGMGGIAVMEVSDPSGRDWAGTAIHENIDSGTNTCEPGKPGCPNSNGQGGSAGSTFTVGAGANPFGLTLPPLRNSFYDLHMFAQRTSILHQQNLTSCEHSCRQLYDCGGQIFGPTFTIHRKMGRGVVVSGGVSVDVTRVDLDKPQNPIGPGDFPGPNLPPGIDYA